MASDFSGVGIADIKLVSIPSLPDKISEPSIVIKLLSLKKVEHDAIHELYSQGTDFLYGMLFDLAFELQPAVRSTIPHANHGELFRQTVAVNVIRQKKNGSSSDVSKEVSQVRDCLKSILASSRQQEERHNQTLCHVYIASDNEKTITQLSSWLTEHSCSISSVKTRAEEERTKQMDRQILSNVLHHFRSVALLSSARSGFVGYNSDSSFIVELIEFRRRYETWKQGRDPPLLKDLSVCRLPEGTL